RFIIRRFSPVVTIGGGVVVDIGNRRYRTAEDAQARLDVMASAEVRARLHLLVREAESGLALPELVSRTGLLENEITTAIAKAPVTVIAQPQPWYVDTGWFQAARDRLGRAVREFHKANPLLPGVSRQDLRNRELPHAPQFILDALLASARDLVVEGET